MHTSSNVQFSRDEVPNDQAIDTKGRDPQRGYMLHNGRKLQGEKGSDPSDREIGGPALTVQETCSLYQGDSCVHKGANTQCLKLVILDRKDLRQERVHIAILRIQVDDMEPVLHDQHMIVVQQDHAAESESGQ